MSQCSHAGRYDGCLECQRQENADLYTENASLKELVVAVEAVRKADTGEWLKTGFIDKKNLMSALDAMYAALANVKEKIHE